MTQFRYFYVRYQHFEEKSYATNFISDTFQIMSPSGRSSPVICGVNDVSKLLAQKLYHNDDYS